MTHSVQLYPLAKDSTCCKSFYFNFISLFLSVPGLCCCVQAFSRCGESGLLFPILGRFLIVVVSLFVENRLVACTSVVIAHGLSSCGTQA